MKFKTTKKCYLCPKEAKEYEAPNTSWNTFMECPECGQYQISHMAIKVIFNRDDSTEILNDDDKLKLSRFIQNQFKQTDKPVLITTKLIEQVTGKRSENISYK